MILPIIPALALEAAQPKLIYPTRPHIVRASARETAALDTLLAGVGPIAAARRRAGAVVPLSSPLDLTGCSFWYDFQDITTLGKLQAGGSPVTATNDPIGLMTDKSGNSRTISQGTTVARPTWGQNGSFHYGSFNGVNRCLQNALANVPVSTVFAVAKVKTTDSDNFGGMLTCLNIQATGVGAVWVRNNGAFQWYVSQAAGDTLADSSHQWVNRTQTTNWSANEAVYSIDGTGHANRILTTGTSIGLDRNIGGRYLEMDLYEMFAYDTILSAGNRARAEQYLGNRYGIILP